MAVDTAEKEQCRANTLKGERCKNKAKDDSGLCGTHLKMAQKQADAQQGADSKPAVKAEQGSGGQTAPPGARKYTTAADAHSTNGRPPPAPSTHPMVTRSKGEGASQHRAVAFQSRRADESARATVPYIALSADTAPLHPTPCAHIACTTVRSRSLRCTQQCLYCHVNIRTLWVHVCVRHLHYCTLCVS